MTDMVIWKYSLGNFTQELRMPLAAKVLHVGQQDGVPTIWAIVDPSQASQARCFHVVPTGGRVSMRAGYYGTVQMPNGNVWHIFEVGGTDHAGSGSEAH